MKPTAKDHTCWMRLANGWTVSLSVTDTPPAICCIAGWPTRQDNLAAAFDTFSQLDLFDFGEDRTRTDCRCWTYGDVRDALKKIAEAMPPDANLSAPQQGSER